MRLVKLLFALIISRLSLESGLDPGVIYLSGNYYLIPLLGGVGGTTLTSDDKFRIGVLF